MPRERRSHQIIIELRRQFLKKLRRVLMGANIFLLLVTHLYQSISGDATDVFKEHGIVKWIYYAFEVLYAISHLIVSMDLSFRSIFHHARTMFGTLGFEMLLWILASYHAWFFINVAILNVALLCSLGPEFLHIQQTNILPLDNGPVLNVQFDLPRNSSIGSGLDGNDFV